MQEKKPRSAGPARPAWSAETLTGHLEQGGTLIGEKLLPISSGPIPVAGSMGGLLALRLDGNVVLVAFLSRISSSAPSQLSDQLARLADAGEEGLAEIAGMPLPGLLRRHTEFFDRRGGAIRLNRDQRVIVVVDGEPSLEAWRSLMAEVGPWLLGVLRTGPQGLETVTPPAISPGSKEGGGLPILTWVGVVGLTLGLVLGLVGLIRTRGAPQGGEVALPAPIVAQASIKTVATGTPAGATVGRWIGQQKLVRTSSGRVILVFPERERLGIVSDQRDQGRGWRSPQFVPGIETETLSVAIDAQDRIHTIYSNDDGSFYVLLDEDRSGWQVDAEIPLDVEGRSPVVDIAWDPANATIHALWVRRNSSGEQPVWGAIDLAGDEPELVQTEALADPGEAISVLGNIAADRNGNVLATYRKGHTAEGWFSRQATPGADGFQWQVEERIPNTAALIGAATLEIDNFGDAHLVLRDDTNFNLTYYKRNSQAGWSSGELFLDGIAIGEVEQPALSIDVESRLVYLFVQTNQFLQTVPEIRFLVRDPASGWEGPFGIADPSQIPGGALYPTTMGLIRGQPIVAWSTLGGGPSINAARVLAP